MEDEAAAAITYDRQIISFTKFDDGDTVWLTHERRLDLDFGEEIVAVSAPVKVRFFGCNAYELSTDKGQQAATFTKNWCTNNMPNVRGLFHGRDKYGRQLVELYNSATGERLSYILIQQGLAVKM